MAANTSTIKTVIFMGSARKGRLGDRVLKYVKNVLTSRIGQLGPNSDKGMEIKYNITAIIDPIEVFNKDNGILSEFSSGELSVPSFFLGNNIPKRAAELRDTIKDADAYVIISPEYNHVVPPALSSIMGHFGGSCYKCKPCGIITYSPSPWGGMRSALSIITMTHELGCLPVSSLVGLPLVNELLNDNGTPTDPNNRILNQLPNMLKQLEWMSIAMKNQRNTYGEF